MILEAAVLSIRPPEGYHHDEIGGEIGGKIGGAVGREGASPP
jgi:hypothetical protein